MDISQLERIHRFGAWQVSLASTQRKLAATVLLVTFVACARTVPTPQLPPPAPPEIQPATMEPAVAPAQEVPASTEVSPRQVLVAEELRPAAVVRDVKIPSLLRVGLATDLPRVALPCCEGDIAAEVGAEQIGLTSSIRVEPDSTSAGWGSYRLQVAAIKDER